MKIVGRGSIGPHHPAVASIDNPVVRGGTSPDRGRSISTGRMTRDMERLNRDMERVAVSPRGARPFGVDSAE